MGYWNAVVREEESGSLIGEIMRGENDLLSFVRRTS